MKKLFVVITLIVSFFNAPAQAEKDFGVIVFYNTRGETVFVEINNTSPFPVTEFTAIYHKVYSEGQLLVTVNHGPSVKLKNITVKSNDTVYLRVFMPSGGKVVLDVVEKPDALREIETIDSKNVFYSSERIDYPYIPESFRGKKSGRRSASGFLISKEGYIVTNYHVVEKTTKVMVRGINGNKNSSLSARVIATDTINDIAILKLEDKILVENPPSMLRHTACDVGENIFVLGYPLTMAMGEDIKLTDGLISSRNGYKGDSVSYQISAPVQPGNSGAPLFDKDGNIVGIINAKLSGAENATYAIKVQYLLQLMTKAGIKPVILPKSTLAGKPLNQQVKAIETFVYIIEAE